MQTSSLEVFSLLILIGRIGGQPINFCLDQFCYNSDGELKNITNIKDAQDYCSNNGSWLLEIYDSNQLNSISANIVGKGPALLNTIGRVANRWTSILGDPLPNDFIVDESFGQDFLFVNASGGKLYLQGADKLVTAAVVCRVPGICPDGYCYEVRTATNSWFRSEAYCYTNGSTVNSGYGHLANFPGLTYNQVANLSFVTSLRGNSRYWIGYSKLIYNWFHSNSRAYFAYFGQNRSLLTALYPNESYYVYMEKKSSILSMEWYEKPLGKQSFLLICMKDVSTTTAAPTTTSLMTSTAQQKTSGGSNPTSNSGANSKESTFLLILLLPVLLWLALSLCIKFS